MEWEKTCLEPPKFKNIESFWNMELIYKDPILRCKIIGPEHSLEILGERAPDWGIKPMLIISKYVINISKPFPWQSTSNSLWWKFGKTLKANYRDRNSKSPILESLSTLPRCSVFLYFMLHAHVLSDWNSLRVQEMYLTISSLNILKYHTLTLTLDCPNRLLILFTPPS